MRAEAKDLRNGFRQMEMKTLFDRSVGFSLSDAAVFLMLADQATSPEESESWLARAETWVLTARMRMKAFGSLPANFELP